MAYGYSTNQFESAFRAKELQNWHSVPRKHIPFPKTAKGHSQFWANDRGHLLAGVPRSTECPFGDYQGTWDMPLKIPPYFPKYTGRSKEQIKKMIDWRATFDYKGFCDGVPEYPKEEMECLDGCRPLHPAPPHTTPTKDLDEEEDIDVPAVSGRAGFTPGPHGYRTDGALRGTEEEKSKKK